MARHVGLGDDMHAARLGVGDDLLDVPGGVALGGGEGALPERGDGGHEEGEGLVVDEVPVQDVELDPGHGVDDALDAAEREEVARRIDQ